MGFYGVQEKDRGQLREDQGNRRDRTSEINQGCVEVNWTSGSPLQVCLQISQKLPPIFQNYEVNHIERQLRQIEKFEWKLECQKPFNELNSYLSSPPLLTKVVDGEILYLYFDISDKANSSV